MLLMVTDRHHIVQQMLVLLIALLDDCFQQVKRIELKRIEGHPSAE